MATTTLPDGAQVGENLAVWREQLVQAKWGDMDNHAVYLGWDADGVATTARYAIQLPERGLTLTQHSVLVFVLADANKDPTSPDQAPTSPVGRCAGESFVLHCGRRFATGHFCQVSVTQRFTENSQRRTEIL